MVKRVLIAEDEANIIEALTFILSREGYEVSVVMDGDAALKTVSEAPPDVMILDVMLPKMNGFEVLKQLRSQPASQQLPIIMLTAKGQSQDRQTALDFGANIYITKPFDNRDLVDGVRLLANG